MEGAEELEEEGAEKELDELEGAEKEETTAKVKMSIGSSILPCGVGQTSAILLSPDIRVITAVYCIRTCCLVLDDKNLSKIDTYIIDFTFSL